MNSFLYLYQRHLHWRHLRATRHRRSWVLLRTKPQPDGKPVYLSDLDTTSVFEARQFKTWVGAQLWIWLNGRRLLFNYKPSMHIISEVQ